MRYLGKLDDYPVYEFKRGAYVIVDPDTEQVLTTWIWFGNLGRNFDTFTKGGENPDEEKCIEVIEKNKDRIIQDVNAYDDNASDEAGKDFLDEQDEFYEKLEEGRVFDWFSGDYVEPEEESEQGN